jgi:hypothetical protein
LIEKIKKGGDKMAVDIKQFELDRIINMLRSFGWSVVESRFEGDKIIVRMEKIVKAETK